jgi:hypothetical protein
LFFDTSASAAKQATIVAAAATVIIDVVTRNILKRSDADLRRFRDRNGKIYRSRPMPSDATYEVDRIFFYLEQIKDEFTTHEWNRIVEAKTTIHQTEYPAE